MTDLSTLPDHELRALKERIFAEEIRREQDGQKSRTLLAFLHNGGSIYVRGTAVSIDMLRGIVIPHPLVKGLVIYEGEGYGRENTAKLEQLNYTELTKMRKEVSD